MFKCVYALPVMTVSLFFWAAPFAGAKDHSGVLEEAKSGLGITTLTFDGKRPKELGTVYVLKSNAGLRGSFGTALAYAPTVFDTATGKQQNSDSMGSSILRGVLNGDRSGGGDDPYIEPGQTITFICRPCSLKGNKLTLGVMTAEQQSQSGTFGRTQREYVRSVVEFVFPSEPGSAQEILAALQKVFAPKGSPILQTVAPASPAANDDPFLNKPEAVLVAQFSSVKPTTNADGAKFYVINNKIYTVRDGTVVKIEVVR